MGAKWAELRSERFLLAMVSTCGLTLAEAEVVGDELLARSARRRLATLLETVDDDELGGPGA